MNYLDMVTEFLEENNKNYIDECVIIEELATFGFKKSKLKKGKRNNECWRNSKGDFITRDELNRALNNLGFKFDKVVKVWYRKGGEAGLEQAYVKRMGEIGNERYEELLIPMKFMHFFAMNEEFEETEFIEDELEEEIEDTPELRQAVETVLGSEETGDFDYLNLPRHRIDAYFPDMLLGEIETLAKKRSTSVILALESIVLEYFELKKIRFNHDKWVDGMVEEREELAEGEEYVF